MATIAIIVIMVQSEIEDSESGGFGAEEEGGQWRYLVNLVILTPFLVVKTHPSLEHHPSFGR